MFLANKLNKGAGVPTPTDAQFNYVTMLLHGDGTNGAQNNTFVDSSTNNFTITRNGNTTQGSFSPYGSNWSNYFDGNDDLNAPSNAAFTYGTSDFTIEGWFFITGRSGTENYEYFFGQGVDAGSSSLGLYRQGGVLKVWNNAAVITGTTTLALNTWNHIALSRSGTTMRLFLNGVQEGSATNSNSISTGTSYGISVGRWTEIDANYIIGYVSNFRVVKGTAVYTSAFTPSTAPLTAISGTSLLTCQSNRFKDNSTNNFTLTVNGNPSVQRFNPFGASTAYSTSVIGGSGYFDGSGDYLTTPSSITLGSGDLTIEGWFYPANTAGSVWFDFRGNDSGSPGNNPVIQWSTVTSGKFTVRINGTAAITSSSTFSINAWYHVALVRSGTTVTLYVNGTSQGTYTTSTSFAQAYSRIGAYGGDGSLPIGGYSSDMRAVVGTAVYTSTFTPPTAPLTAVSGTALLLNMTNGAIFDNAMMNDLETVGNVQISTSVKKYGTGSLAFDGTGDYLKTQYSPNTQLGSGNFTIEFWIYFNSVASGQEPMSGYDNTNLNWGFYLLSSGTLNYYLSSDGSSWNIASGVSVGSVSTGQWYHVALVRNGSTFTPYLNGVAGTTATSSSAIYSNSQGVYIGGLPSGYYFNGYIDDLRITKGYARYTTTFTPPTAAFSDKGPY
jgi:hypothetical protein